MNGERPRASLRRQIVLWYSLVLVVALGGFTVVTHLLLRQALERTGTASLRDAAEYTERLNIPPDLPRAVLSEEQGRERLESGEEIDYLQRRVRLANGLEVVSTATRGTEIEDTALASFRFIALLAIPLTALLAALGGWVLLERLLAPLARLVDTTRSIEIGDLSRRVQEPERPAELHELARSFNGMLTRLERAVEALRRFTADASHELRTPLTSIKGTVQVALVRERTAAELAHTLEEVLEETEWMLQLVEGLLTLAQGEEGGLALESAAVDLSALLEDVGEVGTALAQEKPVEVETRVPPGLQVRGSSGALRQIFLNLVSNAVKFTDRGSVTIAAFPLTRAELGEVPGGWLEITVRDTGIGIGAEELPRVFDRFYRGDAARARPGGTGLGLAIASLLVELHGGKLEATSHPGVGSEFRVVLPVNGPDGMLPRLERGEAAPG